MFIYYIHTFSCLSPCIYSTTPHGSVYHMVRTFKLAYPGMVLFSTFRQITNCQKGNNHIPDFVDIDECSKQPCGTSIHECMNTPGSYKCICRRGYQAIHNERQQEQCFGRLNNV